MKKLIAVLTTLMSLTTLGAVVCDDAVYEMRQDLMRTENQEMSKINKLLEEVTKVCLPKNAMNALTEADSVCRDIYFEGTSPGRENGTPSITLYKACLLTKVLEAKRNE